MTAANISLNFKYNERMVEAAQNGHLEIVQLMLDKGATDYDSVMNVAAQNGHLEIVQLML